MYQTTVLDSGLNVVSAHMPGMQSVCIGAWIKTGGRYETRERAGISHFIEHLLFEETKNRSSEEIKQAIEGIGGSLNGFTSEEMTCYLVKILIKHMDLSFDVLSDMVLNAALSPKSIEKERSVITEEIKMYMDLPGQYVLELLSELMWPGHPLGMFLAGTTETVSSINREDLVEYKNKYYTANNSLLVVAGPVEHEKIVKSCGKYFKAMPKESIFGFEPAQDNQSGARTNLKYKETEQMHAAIGFPAVSSNDPDRFAANLLHIMLGANMSSRLFQEIREKRGLAYEISSGLKKYKDIGVFTVSGGIKNDKFSEAIEVILKELKKIKNEPSSQDELKRAKEFYAGQMLMALEDTADHMVWVGEQLVARGNIMTSQEALKNIDKVTPENISRVAKRFFRPEKLSLAVIGPVKDEHRKNINKTLEILG